MSMMRVIGDGVGDLFSWLWLDKRSGSCNASHWKHVLLHSEIL